MKKMIKDQPDETAAEESAESPEYQKHEIESAAETLTRAEEIKANKSLHAHAMKHLSKKHGHMSAAMGKKPGSLKDLKSLAKQKELEEINDNE